MATRTRSPVLERRRVRGAFAMRLAVMACAVACARAAPPARGGVDSVHRLMEPAHPVPKAPRLKSPVSPPGLVTARGLVLLMPAALAAMAVGAPDMLARLLLQVICFIGSLIEPLDPLLPQKGLLRTLVTTVKSAKKAWYVKQGLPDPSDTSFMDDDDDDDDDDPPPKKPDDAVDEASSADDGAARAADGDAPGAEDAEEDEEDAGADE